MEVRISDDYFKRIKTGKISSFQEFEKGFIRTLTMPIWKIKIYRWIFNIKTWVTNFWRQK